MANLEQKVAELEQRLQRKTQQNDVLLTEIDQLIALLNSKTQKIAALERYIRSLHYALDVNRKETLCLLEQLADFKGGRHVR